MTPDRQHLTDDLLEELADALLAPSGTADEALQEAERHLADCPHCAARLKALRGIGAALRALPLERAPEGFTRSLLRELEERGPARALTLAGWFSGILALLVVGSVLLAVFVSAGVITLPAAGDGGAVEQYWSRGWESLSVLLGPAGKWLSQRLPGTSTVTGLVLTLAVLAGLGLLDRVLGRRFRGESGI
ncbi:MAG TPA: hypothetical protein VF889_01075 [Bacteroidota bacterium]